MTGLNATKPYVEKTLFRGKPGIYNDYVIIIASRIHTAFMNVCKIF